MEISKQELEEMITLQANRVAKESDARMEQYKKDSDKKAAQYRKESDERMERYVGALKEDSDHQMQVVMEYLKEIPVMKKDIASLMTWREKAEPQLDAVYETVQEMKPSLDATFEETGGLKIEIEDIKHRLSLLEEALTLLGRDTAEVKALQARVERLERKIEA